MRHFGNFPKFDTQWVSMMDIAHKAAHFIKCEPKGHKKYFATPYKIMAIDDESGEITLKEYFCIEMWGQVFCHTNKTIGEEIKVKFESRGRGCTRSDEFRQVGVKDKAIFVPQFDGDITYGLIESE